MICGWCNLFMMSSLLLSSRESLSHARRGWPAARREAEVMEGVRMATFGERHSDHLERGDARRTKRLPQRVDEMCQHPGGTLPDKLPDPANLRAFYRLMNAPELTPEAVLAGHSRVTREVMAETAAWGVTVLTARLRVSFRPSRSLPRSREPERMRRSRCRGGRPHPGTRDGRCRAVGVHPADQCRGDECSPGPRTRRVVRDAVRGRRRSQRDENRLRHPTTATDRPQPM